MASRAAVAGVLVVLFGVLGVLPAQAASNDGRVVVRRFEGTHRLAGSEDVRGRLSVTLWSDGSFDASAALESLDCEAIRFSVSQRSRGPLFNDWLRPPVSADLPGEFALDATTLTLHAPPFVHPPTGAVADRGMLRRCSGDDPVVSFRMTLRSESFASLGRYDGDISATLLSGASLQRSFTGTFVMATPRPVTGFRADRESVRSGECIVLRWHALTGAASYAAEFVGPWRSFTVRSFAATAEESRGSGWGVVWLPAGGEAPLCVPAGDAVFTGIYSLRLFALSGTGAILSGTSSSIPISVEVER